MTENQSQTKNLAIENDNKNNENDIINERESGSNINRGGDNVDNQSGTRSDNQQQPPLPSDEQPPLPDEQQPPLPDEEQPPLPDEQQPPLPNEDDNENNQLANNNQQQSSVFKGTNGWMAIYEPNAQTYYYHNELTGITTWSNPFSNITDDEGHKYNYDKEDSEEIDPDLIHLLPTSSNLNDGYQKANFNARTGGFNTKQWRTPDHVNVFNKSRRQQAAFYDIDAFEQQKNEEHAKRKADLETYGTTEKRKLSKGQVKLYKDQKQAKRQKTKTSWLMND